MNGNIRVTATRTAGISKKDQIKTVVKSASRHFELALRVLSPGSEVAQVALRLCSQTALRLLSGWFQIVLRLLPGCSQVALRLLSSCSQVALRLLSGCSESNQMALRLSGRLKLFSGCSHVALSLLSACFQVALSLLSGFCGCARKLFLCNFS